MHSSASGMGSLCGSSSFHLFAPGRRVVIARDGIDGGVGAQDGPLVRELDGVAFQIRLQLVQTARLAQPRDHAQVLSEIVTKRPRLFHVGAQLLIPAQLDGQNVVFLRQAQIPGRFAADAVKQVQKQKIDAERQQAGQNRKLLDAAREQDLRMARHGDEIRTRIARREQPDRAPDALDLVFPQQPAHPAGRRQRIERAHQRREAERDERCGRQADGRFVRALRAGVQQNAQHAADRKQKYAGKKRKGRPPDVERAAQRADIERERKRRQRQQEQVAVHAEVRADRRSAERPERQEAGRGQRRPSRS